MTATERAKTRHRKRRLVAASVIAPTLAGLTACAPQPATPAVSPAQLSDHDVLRLRSLDPSPRAKPRKTPHVKPRHTPTRIGTALSIRHLRVTSYCETGSRTYTGVWPRRGMAAVKKSTGIPFGAVLHVEGYGTFVVTDREPERGVSNVDLYDGWRSDCERYAANFGIKHLDVSIERAA